MRFSTTASLLVLALAAASPTFAQDVEPQAVPFTTPARPTWSAEAFFQTTAYGMAAPSGLAFSSDGSRILISSDQSGVFNAWALPVDGGAAQSLTTSGSNAHFAESWFPADDRVVISADGGGDELSHVYVRETNGGLRDLTPGDAVKAEFVGFSRDGRTLWLTSNARDPNVFDLYAHDTATYEGRLIYRNPGMILSAVSPNGRWVALTKPRTSADSDVYLADLRDGGDPWLITPHQGDAAFGVYGFSHDGRQVILASNQHGEFNQAWSYDLESGAMRPLIEADWDVSGVSFSPGGRYRVSTLNADGSTELTLTDLRSDRPVRLSGVPAGDIGNIRFDAGETRVAFTVASDTSPADVFVADLATGQARRLTSALNPAIDEGQLVEGRVVRYAAPDGVVVPGILYVPRGASAAAPVPAIVLVHGGPGGQSRRGWSAMIQHLVNHGYAVLAANNRGSSGYGKTFFHMDDRAHGEADLDDIVAAGQWLRDQSWVAGDQVAVMGGSYGGFMVAAALAFRPDAFTAGIDIFGVTNWERTLQSIPAWWGAERDALFDEMGDPATDYERHRRISPLFHAGRIQRPLLVVQGANDPRVLQVESDELVAAVRAHGVPVDYLVFPDEGHGFLRKANRIAAQEAYLAFLEQYVRGAAVD